MSRRSSGAPVVITRKDKRMSKLGHGLAFALTGGTSMLYTAAKGASNAAYNARTRELQRQAEEAQREPSVSQAEHDRAIADGQAFMARLEREKAGRQP
jgi:hypothetical protein